jgi:hypothetical protein
VKLDKDGTSFSKTVDIPSINGKVQYKVRVATTTTRCRLDIMT